MIMSLINRTKWIKNFLIAINSKYLILRIFTKFREISWVFNLRKNFCEKKFRENLTKKLTKIFLRKNFPENFFRQIHTKIFSWKIKIKFSRKFVSKKFSFKILREKIFSFNENYFTKKFAQIFCVKTTKKYYRENFFREKFRENRFSRKFFPWLTAIKIT